MLALGSTWVDALVEALLRCKEADALGAESGEGHDIDEVERRPRHVIAHHLEVHQLEHRLLLRALHRALELLLDLGDARGDVARLVARVRAHALDHVRRGLLEHRRARHASTTGGQRVALLCLLRWPYQNYGTCEYILYSTE